MTDIKVSAPGKLMLFGEHAVVYGKPCIVTAVDQRVWVEAGFNGKDELIIDAPQLGITNYKKAMSELCSREMLKQVSFIEAAVKCFYLNYGLNKGAWIKTQSDFSYTFGFGSSSAVTVATLKALACLYKINISDKELFNLAYKTVLEIQGVGSGFDLAAALWGRTIYFIKGAQEVRDLNLANLPILVVYSGVKADTPTLIRQVAELKRKKPKKIDNIFDKIEHIVLAAQNALGRQNWIEVGQLMTDNQRLLEQLGVSTYNLEKLIAAAIKAGAYGAKLSGAGGGDCIITICAQDKRVQIKKALEKAGGQVIQVKLNAKGVIC